MASVLATHAPITVVSTISGNQEKIQNYPEAAGQTFNPGTPVVLGAASGTPLVRYTTASANATGAGSVLGISALRGKNLPSNGAGVSPTFGAIGFPGGLGAVQDVPNQPAAYSIYHGAPFIDGLTMVAIADLDTIFEIQVDNSTGAGVTAASIGDVGSVVNIVADANGWWYADLSTIGGSPTSATIVSLNPLDFVPGSTTVQQSFGHIRIVFTTTVIQALQ